MNVTRTRKMSCVSVVVLVMAAVAGAQTDAPALPVFPLARGTSWVYEGKVTYQLTPAEVTTQNMRWRMEVQAVVDGANFHAALIKGGPWDLEFYTNGKPPGNYLIVSTNDTTYMAEGHQAREVFSELKKSGLSHEAHDTLGENIWFRTPLHPNGIYCAPDQIAREDRMNCWTVTDARTVRLAGIAGVKAGERMVYELAFRTNPDHQIVNIVPGIGIVHFIYAHHGSPSEVDIRLLEFHAGK